MAWSFTTGKRGHRTSMARCSICHFKGPISVGQKRPNHPCPCSLLGKRSLRALLSQKVVRRGRMAPPASVLGIMTDLGACPFDTVNFVLPRASPFYEPYLIVTLLSYFGFAWPSSPSDIGLTRISVRTWKFEARDLHDYELLSPYLQELGAGISRRN